MRNAEDHIEKVWITTGSSGIWPTCGTSSRVPFYKLPPLPPTDSSFSWLADTGAEDWDYGYTLNNDGNKLDSLGLVYIGSHRPSRS
jgi:hypothetical protein